MHLGLLVLRAAVGQSFWRAKAHEIYLLTARRDSSGRPRTTPTAAAAQHRRQYRDSRCPNQRRLRARPEITDVLNFNPSFATISYMLVPPQSETSHLKAHIPPALTTPFSGLENPRPSVIAPFEIVLRKLYNFTSLQVLIGATLCRSRQSKLRLYGANRDVRRAHRFCKCKTPSGIQNTPS